MSELNKVEHLNKPRKVISMLDPCKKGSHTFIITKWLISGGKQKATEMKCQHCLMPVEVNEQSQDWIVDAKWLNESKDK